MFNQSLLAAYRIWFIYKEPCLCCDHNDEYHQAAKGSIRPAHWEQKEFHSFKRGPSLCVQQRCLLQTIRCSKISQTCGAIINIDHESYMYLFQRKVQWCCWGTTPKGAKWILEQYCILDYCPQVRRPWKPSLWGCFFGGGWLQNVRGVDNQNQTLVVNLSQQSTGKKQKKGPSGITFYFPLHSKINSWWCR